MLPWLHGDAWGEEGGLIAEFRVHLLLCHPVHLAGLSLPGLGTAESQEKTGTSSHWWSQLSLGHWGPASPWAPKALVWHQCQK